VRSACALDLRLAFSSGLLMEWLPRRACSSRRVRLEGAEWRTLLCWWLESEFS
jgi:hypothetical protein